MSIEHLAGARRPTAFGRTLRIALLAVLVQGASGCGVLPAGQDPPYPGQEPSATIVVTASRSAYLGATIHITSGTGFRSRLGAMSVGGRERFVVRDLRPGPHRLEAGLQGTGTLQSREFMLQDGDAVEWDLESNEVFYR